MSDAKEVRTDTIGGFPFIHPNCRGCDKPLTVENAWMTDGCPCNSELGVNNFNETRWRLLMELQQRQARELEQMKEELDATECSHEDEEVAHADTLRLLALRDTQLAAANARLAEIDEATKADADDLEKMRDGTKLTRAGCVQIIVYQRQDIDELKGQLAAEKARNDELFRIGVHHQNRADKAESELAASTAECERLKEDSDTLKAFGHFHQMLLDIGKPIGSIHLDERLPLDIGNHIDSLKAELAALRTAHESDSAAMAGWKGLATYYAESLKQAAAMCSKLESLTDGTPDDENFARVVAEVNEALHQLSNHVCGTDIGAHMDYGAWMTKDGWSDEPPMGDVGEPKMRLLHLAALGARLAK